MSENLSVKAPLYVQEEMPAFLANEDPQQRLAQWGAEGLRNCELLAVILGAKTQWAAELLDAQEVSQLATLPFPELAQRLTPRQAGRLVASLELSRRVLQQGLGVMPVISCPVEVVPMLVEIKDQPKEHFLTLFLNARNQLIHKEVISIGSLSASIVHPREVFRVAIHHAAASIILAHNHPSGDVSASRDDIELTRRIVKAGEIMGIEVLDHIIIGATDFMSMKEQGGM
jgi:DNA repair protein RadC